MVFVLGLTACGRKTSDTVMDNSSQAVEKVEENISPASVVAEPDKTEADMTEAKSCGACWKRELAQW